uniref:Carcinustatin-17 n=1 Tax=Carcinus maenas TaxID=6759 RepID=ALL17_CARMA|nr:RecName: Full=Carcinustatin-17 [Carcinus maenas]
SGQYSFGL